jgi:hypothetical protein
MLLRSSFEYEHWKWVSPQDGYHFESVTNGCSVSDDGIFYVRVPDRDGLYVLNLIVMKHISIVWMPRDANSVMIIPRSCGIAVLVILV